MLSLPTAPRRRSRSESSPGTFALTLRPVNGGTLHCIAPSKARSLQAVDGSTRVKPLIRSLDRWRGGQMARETLLISTLVELADNLVDDFDVIDLLTVLSDRCVEAIDVDAAGVMLASPGGELQFVASSSESMRVLELFQIQADEGPCVDCFKDGKAIVNYSLSEADGR